MYPVKRCAVWNRASGETRRGARHPSPELHHM